MASGAAAISAAHNGGSVVVAVDKPASGEPHGQCPVAIFWEYLAAPPEASVDLVAAIDWLSKQPYVHKLYMKRSLR